MPYLIGKIALMFFSSVSFRSLLRISVERRRKSYNGELGREQFLIRHFRMGQAAQARHATNRQKKLTVFFLYLKSTHLSDIL